LTIVAADDEHLQYFAEYMEGVRRRPCAALLNSQKRDEGRAGERPVSHQRATMATATKQRSDVKDLGADADHVGPGAAYENWQKTPAYQEWRKKTEELMSRP
jgi:hypothetical protein